MTLLEFHGQASDVVNVWNITPQPPSERLVSH